MTMRRRPGVAPSPSMPGAATNDEEEEEEATRSGATSADNKAARSVAAAIDAFNWEWGSYMRQEVAPAIGFISGDLIAGLLISFHVFGGGSSRGS
ncbi:hypothetical protein OsI_01488 [Oryza sativa Indica Group]|uniref:Uncharacterized protein n=1 Tax=Oryza sativa subsp. indica TaxID=39946 RepID=B8A6M2_ORYSI|nr:hypothetical protein OsI_01488 [Oryza sativa Indica Group]